MSLLNSFFWLSYGIAIRDEVICIPNASGFFLGVVQLVLCVVFSNESEIDTTVGDQLMKNSEHAEDQDSSMQNENVEII